MPSIKLTYLDKTIHEMNAQIHSISLLSDIMLDKNYKLNETQKIESLEHINNAASKLSKIASSLSSINNFKSNRICIQLEKINLIELINREVNHHQLQNFTNQNLTIRLYNKINECIAQVDSFWFSQMLTNLITNAVNHCDRGIIKIHIDTFNKNDNNYFRLTVEDEGYGILNSELETIFEPSKRGSHSINKNILGSGIGLAIVKEIVEAHNGNITARNGPIIGAVFEITIPLYN